MKPNPSRRQALLASAGVLTSVAIGNAIAQASNAQELSRTKSARPSVTNRNPICVFSKPFNSLSFDELAERIAELGFDGLEAPIRKGGHVEPANIEEQLPRLVEALKKCDLEITIMASDINDPSDPFTESTLKAAAGLGIQRYRMKYFKYDLKRPIPEQIDQWRSQLLDLAALNRELGIQAIYQNHAGKNNFGAPIWDLARALEGIEVNEIGVAFDIRHATVEGGTSWPITFKMIQPHIDTVYVKDFIWEGRQLKNVPLGTGLISPEFFKMLSEAKFAGPISLHEEYIDHRNPELVPDHLAAIQQDMAVLQKLLNN